MITEHDLMHNSRYRFSHIELEVVEYDENEKVAVFVAMYLTTKLPGQSLSPGLMEINKTLWNESSTKRPPGYWVYGGSEELGLAKSYFVSDEWLEKTPKDRKKAKREEWGIK